MAKRYGPDNEWDEKVKLSKSKKEISNMDMSDVEKKIAEFRNKLN
ncbi:MAG: hypothetical protein ACP5N7_03365 [Candidatus Pacearchaeota archaeon]